jgi:pyocin large subunit-like protein
MAGFRTALGLALSVSAAAAVLAACDNGPSAVRAKSAAADAPASAAAGGSDERSSFASRTPSGGGVDHRKDAVKLVEGKPVWSPSRRYSAEENAQRAFERNGEIFGASSIDQYVKKAHAFVDHPPAGTLTLTRANGDTLFYDPKANVFAVANKDGAPRTMFKPDEGRAYWDKQKDRESQRQASRRSKRNPDDAA